MLLRFLGRPSRLSIPLRAAAIVAISCAVGLPLHYQTVLSAATQGSCQPQGRQSDYDTSRFDGWDYPDTGTASSTVLGGAQVTANTYGPFVSSDSPNDFVAAWSLLDVTTVLNTDYAQIGYLDYPPDHSSQGISGAGPWYFIQFNEDGNQESFIGSNDWASEPTLGSSHQYTTLFNNTQNGVPSNSLSFRLDGVQVDNLNGLPVYFQANFQPNQTQVYGETLSNTDQMMGDTTTPEELYDSQYWNNGWNDINNPVGQAETFSSEGAYGQTEVPNSQASDLNIWDYACPPHMMTYTVSGGTYPGLDLVNTSQQGNTIEYVYPGTNASIAQLSDGSYVVAFQGTNGDLCMYTSGNLTTNCTGLGMDSSTSSPSVAALPNNEFVIAFRVNTNALWTYIGSEGGGGSYSNTNEGMMANTNPAIAATSNGGWVASFQANTGYLYLYYNGAAYDEGLGMDPYTSPAMTSTSSGGWQLMFQANIHTLFWLDPTSQPCGSNVCNTQQGMNASSSPSITQLSSGVYAAAFQDNTSSYVLRTWYSSDIGSSNSTGQGMYAGTNPSIVGTADDGEWVAFDSNLNHLCDWSEQAGSWDSGQVMPGGASPAIAN